MRTEEPITMQLPSIQELAIRNGQLHLLHAPKTEKRVTLDWEAIQLFVYMSGQSLEGTTVGA